jgi:UDP-glucose 4-epimerase
MLKKNKEKKVKATVFGGSGFVGSHVCDKLSEAGYDVTIFDIKPSPWKTEHQKMIVGDILDENAVFGAVKGSRYVFNFAGIADIGVANQKPLDTAKYNVIGNMIILEASLKAKIERYIFASSVYVYSKNGGFYRCSKQASEAFIDAYHESHNLEYTILRYGSLYGPRSNIKNGIYRFISEAIHDGIIHYYGSPDALREYIYVEDAARSTVKILSPEFANQSIVLTGSYPMKVGNVLKMIAEILDQKIELNFNHNTINEHYETTPYSYIPKTGRKLISSLQVDLGQGILTVIEDILNGKDK